MAKDIKQLALALGGGEAAARLAAAESLAQSGEEAQGAAVALVKACGTDNEALEWVVAALEGLGPPAHCDLAELTTLTAASNADVAYWAITLLGRAGDEARSSADALARSLGSTTASVQQRAAWALGQIGADSPVVRAALEKAAGASDARLASLSREALEKLR